MNQSRTKFIKNVFIKGVEEKRNNKLIINNLYQPKIIDTMPSRTWVSLIYIIYNLIY